MDKPMLVSRGDGVQGFEPLGWCHASRVGLQEADSHHAPLALMDEKPEAAHWSVAAGNWLLGIGLSRIQLCAELNAAAKQGWEMVIWKHLSKKATINNIPGDSTVKKSSTMEARPRVTS